MNNKGKEGSLKGIFFVMIMSLVIAFYWDKIKIVRDVVGLVLDPTAGTLLSWNLTLGMLAIVFLISLIITLFQKYATDQETLKELKKEQKKLSKETQKFKHDPAKMAEFQKELFPLMMKTMKLSMRPLIYTGIPIILFFRWFLDYFNAIGNPQFFGFLSWFWFYLFGSIIFSSVLRKVLKVV